MYWVTCLCIGDGVVAKGQAYGVRSIRDGNGKDFRLNGRNGQNERKITWNLI